MLSQEDRIRVSRIANYSFLLVLCIIIAIILVIKDQIASDAGKSIALVSMLSLAVLWNSWHSDWRPELVSKVRLVLSDSQMRKFAIRAAALYILKIVLLVSLLILTFWLSVTRNITPDQLIFWSSIVAVYILTHLVVELIGRWWKEPTIGPPQNEQ